MTLQRLKHVGFFLTLMKQKGGITPFRMKRPNHLQSQKSISLQHKERGLKAGRCQRPYYAQPLLVVRRYLALFLTLDVLRIGLPYSTLPSTVQRANLPCGIVPKDKCIVDALRSGFYFFFRGFSMERTPFIPWLKHVGFLATDCKNNKDRKSTKAFVTFVSLWFSLLNL